MNLKRLAVEISDISNKHHKQLNWILVEIEIANLCQEFHYPSIFMSISMAKLIR